jgi:hypothetical protein
MVVCAQDCDFDGLVWSNSVNVIHCCREFHSQCVVGDESLDGIDFVVLHHGDVRVKELDIRSHLQSVHFVVTHDGRCMCLCEMLLALRWSSSVNVIHCNS